MHRNRLRPALILANGVLALAVIVTLAAARPILQPNLQPNAGPRLRGEYTMVAGRTTSSGKDAIYILDATSREMVAIRWENSRKAFVGIGYRSLEADSILPPAR